MLQAARKLFERMNRVASLFHFVDLCSTDVACIF
jgi:hypothetical protein